MINIILSGIVGLVVGDALGVPVEFKKRKELKTNPVKGMRAFGIHYQPAGTWSDDSSMTLATLDSLRNGLNYEDIMDAFVAWYEKSKYTALDEVFDIGDTTLRALKRYAEGESALKSGSTAEDENGNGSLMRVLPILFYLKNTYGEDFFENKDAFEIIHNISRLTHAHNISLIACGIYISIANSLLKHKTIKKGVEDGIRIAFKYYESKTEFSNDLKQYDRLNQKDFKNIEEEFINSNGYVVSTLEASIWCLLNSTSYEEAVLKAVNLGEDTDTTGAVTGSLAGLYYGYQQLPKLWVDKVIRINQIKKLCEMYVDKIEHMDN